MTLLQATSNSMTLMLTTFAISASAIWSRENDLEHEMVDHEPSLSIPHLELSSRPLTPMDKELVIIRTYMPTDSMKKRFHKIISELYDREVIISINVHENVEDPDSEYAQYNNTELQEILNRENVANEALIKEFGDRVYVYSDSMVEKIFPTVSKAPKLIYEENEKWYAFPYGKWLFNECVRTAIDQHTNRSGTYAAKGAWMLVDDVVYTGNWRDLFERYSPEKLRYGPNQNRTAAELERDGNGYLLSTQNQLSNSTKEWFWVDHATESFKRKYFVNDQIYKHTEQIVFYSASFLDTLKESMLKGEHSQSEIGTPSVCVHNGCRTFDIIEIDESGFYQNIPSHTPAVARQHVKELWEKHEEKIVHPCKY